MAQIVSIKGSKFCAFCEYWNDPANRNIKLVSNGRFEINANASEACTQRNSAPQKATSSCYNFELRSNLSKHI